METLGSTSSLPFALLVTKFTNAFKHKHSNTYIHTYVHNYRKKGEKERKHP